MLNMTSPPPHWRGLEIIPYLGSHAVWELALGERLRGQSEVMV